MTGPRRVAATLLATGLCTVLPGVVAMAHPLGNFTTNSYLGVTVSVDRISIDHVLDLAEIPTLQATQRIDVDADGELSADEIRGYRQQTCASAASQTTLLVDGTDVPLTPSAVGEATFLPGEAGLDTLRLECEIVAEHDLDGRPTTIEVRQPASADRIGWHEITIAGDGVGVLESDVPANSLSQRLSAYPDDPLASPLDVRTATAEVAAGASSGVEIALPDAVPATVARAFERLNAWFTGLVAVEELTVPFGLIAVVVAIGLGTLHALAPGHGKTVMAAYLVGRQGTPRDALLLGGTVAVTHTLGVFLLGVVLSATQTVSPERLYPWLGAASGALFAIVGVTLLRQAVKSRTHGHLHSHDHAHPHVHSQEGHGAHVHSQEDHGAHVHSHEGQHAHVGTAVLAGGEHGDAAPGRQTTGWRSLLAPGLAGGLVPSPSALLVLLGGFAIGRAWFGVGLVVAYGVGMAATLVGAGYALLQARHRIQLAVQANRRWTRAAVLFRWLPVGTASLIVAGGVVIVTRSLLAL